MTFPFFRKPPAHSRLSAEEAAELAAQVAQLAQAGLPLEDGLRALAAEVPGRLASVFLDIAGRISAGAGLDSALEAQETRLPPHVSRLMLAAVRSGRLGMVLPEFVELERGLDDLRRRLWLTMAYPVFLMGFLLVLFVLGQMFFTPVFKKFLGDFGVALPGLTRFVLYASGAVVWTVVIPAALLFALLVLAVTRPGARGIAWLTGWIPSIGPLWRWGRMAYFSRMMGLLLAEQIPLPEALRLTAAGLPDACLAAACRRAADRVEAGQSAAESLAAQRQFARSLIPLIEWGERVSALPEAFRAAAEQFEGRAQGEHLFLDAVVLPLVYVLILGGVGLMVTALLLPLISLIRMLSV